MQRGYAHLLVLETEEEDLLHDGQPRRLASETGILVFAFEVARVVCDLAAAFECRTSVESRGVWGIRARGCAAVCRGSAVKTPGVVGIVVPGRRGRCWNATPRETSRGAHGMRG